MHRGAIDPGEGPDEAQQTEQAEYARLAEGRSEGDDVDPVAAQVLRPVMCGENAAEELGNEDDGDGEFDKFELWLGTRARLVDQEPEGDKDDRKGSHAELPRDVMALN